MPGSSSDFDAFERREEASAVRFKSRSASTFEVLHKEAGGQFTWQLAPAQRARTACRDETIPMP